MIYPFVIPFTGFIIATAATPTLSLAPLGMRRYVPIVLCVILFTLALSVVMRLVIDVPMPAVGLDEALDRLLFGRVVVGIICAAIAGLTATLAIALFAPVTFAMDPAHGLVMLGGIHAGSIFGGSISAILIGVPGTPASIVTGWEGYALARRGEAPLALGLAALGSGVGGLVSAVVMLCLSPAVARLALAVGPPELVALLRSASSSSW